jgi:mRNA-degrading endonuclease YafQ of YafQ-DinJ toxin-antitoxin module
MVDLTISSQFCRNFLIVTVTGTILSDLVDVMKILVRLHQINAIVRSHEEHAARTINACAAAGLRDRHEC